MKLNYFARILIISGFISNLFIGDVFAATRRMSKDSLPNYSKTTMDDSLLGHYGCTGLELGSNQKYLSNLTISTKNDSYYLTWQFSSGEIFTGVGILLANHLIASFALNNTHTHTGIQAYEIKDSVLSGPWIINSSVLTKGKETCTKIIE